MTDPITVSLTYSPSNPKPGDTVTFHVAATDPNTWIGARGILFGDGHGTETMPEGFCSGTPESVGKSPHGPWDPPPKNPDHEEFDYTNAYGAPGTYTVKATVDGPDYACGGLPVAYAGEGSATATVTVIGPPVSTTTTTTG